MFTINPTYKDSIKQVGETTLEVSPTNAPSFDIIVEGPSQRDENTWFGRTSGNKMVLFPKDDSLKVGDTVTAHIDRAQTWVCYGSIIK